MALVGDNDGDGDGDGDDDDDDACVGVGGDLLARCHLQYASEIGAWPLADDAVAGGWGWDHAARRSFG
jgi:hypothetical protein